MSMIGQNMGGPTQGPMDSALQLELHECEAEFPTFRGAVKGPNVGLFRSHRKTLRSDQIKLRPAGRMELRTPSGSSEREVAKGSRGVLGQEDVLRNLDVLSR